MPDYVAALGERLDGVRVGVLTNFLDAAVDPEVRAAVRQAVDVLAESGAHIRELAIPELESEAIQAVMPLLLAEATHSHREWLDARAADYTPTVLERLQAGRGVTAVAYFEAGETRERIRRLVRGYQSDLDVLVLPTTPFPATPLESTTLEVGQGEQDLTALIRMTAPFDLTGATGTLDPVRHDRQWSADRPPARGARLRRRARLARWSGLSEPHRLASTPPARLSLSTHVVNKEPWMRARKYRGYRCSTISSPIRTIAPSSLPLSSIVSRPERYPFQRNRRNGSSSCWIGTW